MSGLAQRVEELAAVARARAAGRDALAETARALAGRRAQLRAAREEHDQLAARCALLEGQNAALRDAVESRDYQIRVLSRNLRAYLDREDAQQ